MLLLLEVLSRKVINMAVVVKMAGTSPELYSCIAPLVMNPEIIKYNHNYPFKTSESFVWFVASSEEQVVGFFPVEVRKKSAVINNYYVSNNDEDVFLSLLEAVINEFMGAENVLEAVVQKPHESFFLAQGFEIERTWSLYLKMKKSMKKNDKSKNVYELTQERLTMLFKEFDNIYVSFSGGKDSGVLLNLCIDYIRRNNLNIKLGVFFMDYEVQYDHTIAFVNRFLEQNKDVLEVYRICVPFKVRTCTSMYQHYWRPWDEALRDIWVREMPEGVMKAGDFAFFHDNMWDYEFQLRFAAWLHEKKKAVRTACLVGIRTQESYNRWRTIYGGLKQQLYHNYQWTSKIANDVYNLYPIYDWKTTDIWTANGKFGWDYNRLYDLYYYAGVSLERQRVASPFISEAIESLHLYKAIEPDTWGRMIGRVNGVNFSAIYGGTHAMGYGSVKLPEGHTWKSFMEFLLSTLPEETRRGYLSKLHTSIKFWRTKGGCLSDETIAKLESMNIPITVRNKSNYKTTKRPVMMDYLDDIDIAEFREIPTYKRMCLCILRNDYACKYMGFAVSKEEKKMKDYILQQYKKIWT